MPDTYDLIVIGGGLAGLTAALYAVQQGQAVLLIDKHTYPRHRVCGEYVSREVLPLFAELGIDLHALRPKEIDHLVLSSPAGRTVALPLPLGGLGLSRHAFDQFLYQVGEARGVDFALEETVREVGRLGEQFEVKAASGRRWSARAVITAHGKRSNLDRQWERPFFRQRSPYLGVKFHAEWEMPADRVELHNFQAGYCGVSQVETGQVNVCYLTTRDQLKAQGGSLAALEARVLSRNPHLKKVLRAAQRTWEQPLVINEVSFAPKAPVERGMLMAGDAAGLITPLCGNGMAMAIQGGYLAAQQSVAFLKGQKSRAAMEKAYAEEWHQLFRRRLWVGRQVQALFRHGPLSEAAVGAMALLPPVARQVIRLTHG